jgi:hypothetical protein
MNRRRAYGWLLMSAHLVACTSTYRVAPPQAPAGEAGAANVSGRITGAVLRDGRELQFRDDLPVQVTGDTLRATSSFSRYRPSPSDTLVAIPMSSVQYLMVRRTSVGKTLAVIVAVPVVALGVLAALVAASSCPFVYSWDGERWVLDAEPYGGAVTKGLERDDVGELEHLRPHAGEYRLLVTNEMRETQYTNQLRLLVVDHAPGARVTADETGRVHALTALRGPTRATVGGRQNVTELLAAVDGRAWAPEPALDEQGRVRRELVLELSRPPGARELKLLVRAATTPWGAMTLRTMLEMRGQYVDAWYRAIDTDPASAELLHAWNLREELFMLKLDVEEADGWRTRAVLGGGGPAVSENRVVTLDVSAARGETVRVRLRPPAGFWSIDAVQVAHGRDATVRVDTVAPRVATDAKRGDVLPALAQRDDRYHDMPALGDRADVRFAAPPPRAGQARTVLLHSRGYYRLHLPPGRVADLATLQRITDVPDEAARWAIAHVRLPATTAERTP